jgi:hypothetical protein
VGRKSQISAEAGEELAWIAANELAKLASLPILTMVVQARHLRKIQKEASSSSELPPNPRFVANGHDGFSPRTLSYLLSRSCINAASAGLEGTSALASGVTQVDIVGTGKAGNALASTVVHMVQLRAIGAHYRQSDTITAWIDAVLRAKAMKSGIRAADLAGAAIPIGAVGIGTAVATAMAKAGVQLTMGTLIGRVAMELHWRAYVEMMIGDTNKSQVNRRDKPLGKPTGPASAVLFELFRRRGLTRFQGQYDVAALIHEPAGFLAVRDKLLLL